MYFLKDDAHKFVIFWNARCACTSVKNWVYFYTKNIPEEFVGVILKGNVQLPSTAIHSMVPYNEEAYRELTENNGYKKVIVVRNPYDRFVSVLDHPILGEFGLKTDTDVETAEKLLAFLEEKGCLIDHHFGQQVFLPDNPDADFSTVISKFDHVIRCEDGDVTKQLNTIFNCSRHFELNVSDKKDKIQLSYEQRQRIRKLYEKDFKFFYW